MNKCRLMTSINRLFLSCYKIFLAMIKQLLPHTPLSNKLSFLSLIFVCTIYTFGYSQIKNKGHLDSYKDRLEANENSILAKLQFTNIGPTIFSGRVTDIEVNPKNPSHFYVAYASGGLWETKNNGTSFSPIFDQEAVMTIGDIAIDWTKNIIWVGTGEVNSSRSSYAGIGMYRSENNGESWEHRGLIESEHIGRIILFPNNQDKIAVAVLGSLYSTNEHRGVYLSNDQGMSWNKTLYLDESTGAVDMIIDPTNEEILYVAMWTRLRKAWNFIESGKNSGIYKSIDGGSNWEKISLTGSGFPDGEGTGRIGLAISSDASKIYAILDNYNRRPKEPSSKSDKLAKNDFKDMDSLNFMALNNDKLNTFLKSNGFPKEITAASAKSSIKSGEIKPEAFAEYLESANSLLFDTPVKGAEVYVSDNNGEKWLKTHDYYLNSVYNSYGYYFGQIRVSPLDDNRIYIMGVPILKSDDGGKTFTSMNDYNVHADHHALWVSPTLDGHVINGNDGGINISYDDGKTWIKCNSPLVGQFYTINVDNADPYRVYGGLQDNGVWVGEHTSKENTRWHAYGNYPYQSIMGGDGMQIQIDSRDNETVYTGFQFGNYFRQNTRTKERAYITPKHKLGDRPYRWNWQAPILLSSHNQDIFYMGANKLLRSMDQGNNFDEISDDLTQGGKKGDVPFGTLTAIHESPLKFGLLYTGSDDGAIHVSKDAGNSWQKINRSLPKDKWVSRIQASAHVESRVYLSLNDYRNDNRTNYLYRSDDYGENWETIGTDIPNETVNVIKEDQKDPNIIYVGTDHSLYVSFNGGQSFLRTGENLPHVPIHDLVVQEREDHLLLGTHGRSFYKADLSVLRSVKENQDKAIAIIGDQKYKHQSSWGKKRRFYDKVQEPTIEIPYFSDTVQKVEIEIKGENGKTFFKTQDQAQRGLNYFKYDLTIDANKKNDLIKWFNKQNEKDLKVLPETDNQKTYLLKGNYDVILKAGGQKVNSKLTIE